MTRQGLSVSAKITTVVLFSLVSLALVALVVNEHRIRRCSRRQRDRMITSWVELGARQIGEAAAGRYDLAHASLPLDPEVSRAIEQFRRWAWSVLCNDESIVALLVGADGTVLDRVPKGAAVRGLDTRRLTIAPTEPVSLRVGGVEQMVHVVSCPIHRGHDQGAIGQLVLLTSQQESSFDRAGFLTVVLLLSAATFLAVVVAHAWARRAVGRALKLLSRPESKQGPAWAASLPVGRDDELGGVARNLASLVERTSRAETRVQLLEKTVQTRITDRTKRIEVMLRQAQNKAWIDPLTGLYNRRFLDEKLELLFGEQCAAGDVLTIVMFDIDHFKVLNDTQGHAAGDRLLAFVGELLRGSLRSTDIGVRYGGDEFLILLLGTSPDDGAAIAERLVHLFQQHASLLPVEPKLTVSAGVASTSADPVDSGADLLDVADRTLYRAKQSGRNTVATRRVPQTTSRRE